MQPVECCNEIRAARRCRDRAGRRTTPRPRTGVATTRVTRYQGGSAAPGGRGQRLGCRWRSGEFWDLIAGVTELLELGLVGGVLGGQLIFVLGGGSQVVGGRRVRLGG